MTAFASAYAADATVTPAKMEQAIKTAKASQAKASGVNPTVKVIKAKAIKHKDKAPPVAKIPPAIKKSPASSPKQ